MTDTTILVLSDMHVGAIDAIRMEPDNELQRITRSKYIEIIRQVKPKIVICLGDMVNGYNEKSHGLGNWTTDLHEQVADAEKLLELTHAKQFYGVTGTPYHIGSNLNADAILYERLGAEYGTDMALDIDGVSFYCCHKIGTSASIYQQSAMSVQMTKSAIWKDRLGDFKVQLRGHAHEFNYQGTHGHLGVKCPCWKGRDEFAASRGMNFNPDLGAVWFRTHDGEFSWGHVVFNLPAHLLIPRHQYGEKVKA